MRHLLATAICAGMFCFSPLFAFDKNIKHKDFSITLSSQKDFTAGSNDFSLAIKKDNQQVKADEVSISFMMPEMPGMPKMTEKAKVEYKGDNIQGNVSFPHGGTWQIRISFMIDGKKYNAKSSIDF